MCRLGEIMAVIQHPRLQGLCNSYLSLAKLMHSIKITPPTLLLYPREESKRARQWLQGIIYSIHSTRLPAVAASIKCPVACGAGDRVCHWQTRKNFCLKNFFGERHWSSHYRSPIICYRSPIVTWQTVYRVFTTAHRLPFTDYLLPLTDYHSSSIKHSTTWYH